MNQIDLDAGAFCIENFISPEQCQLLITNSENVGYEYAEIQTGSGGEVITEIRNNDRVIFDDFDFADELYTRIEPFLSIHEDSGWIPSSLNERFRFYKYTPGQYFKWHIDGSFRRSSDERSLLTFMIYLNEGFEGGNTKFNSDVVAPKEGMALVFPHELRHQGCDV